MIHKTALIWSTPYCTYCNMAKKLLLSKQYNVIEKTIDGIHLKHSDLLREVPEAKTVPQIFIDGKYIGGYTDLVGYLKK